MSRGAPRVRSPDGEGGVYSVINERRRSHVEQNRIPWVELFHVLAPLEVRQSARRPTKDLMSPDRFELLAAIAARTRENAFSEANADPDGACVMVFEQLRLRRP